VALYLGGDIAFRLALGIRPVAFRVAAAAVALATVALGVAVAALAQLIGLLVALVVMLIAEQIQRGRAGSRSAVDPRDAGRD
jgi:hypothetical protein